jgi:hypothetical protein
VRIFPHQHITTTPNTDNDKTITGPAVSLAGHEHAGGSYRSWLLEVQARNRNPDVQFLTSTQPATAMLMTEPAVGRVGQLGALVVVLAQKRLW